MHRIFPRIALLLLNSLLLCAPQARAQDQEPPTSAASAISQGSAGVGLRTVAAALDELRTKPGVAFSTTKPDSWLIASEPGGMVVWSFTPVTHPAYPAVVRRRIVVGQDGGVRIETTGLCEADKAPCDKLMNEFQEMNANAQQEIQLRLKAQGKR